MFDVPVAHLIDSKLLSFTALALGAELPFTSGLIEQANGEIGRLNILLRGKVVAHTLIATSSCGGSSSGASSGWRLWAVANVVISLAANAGSGVDIGCRRWGAYIVARRKTGCKRGPIVFGQDTSNYMVEVQTMALGQEHGNVDNRYD